MAFMTKDWTGTEKFQIDDFDSVDFLVGNAKQAVHYYRTAFGFEPLAYSGPETGQKDFVTYVLKQDKIHFTFTTPLKSNHPYSERLKQHGDGVMSIGFKLPRVKEAFETAMKCGGKEAYAPKEIKDAAGSLMMAGVRTYGDTIHQLIDRSQYRGVWAPGFVEAKLPKLAVKNPGLISVDHIVGNVPEGEMDRWTKYYQEVFGLGHFIRFDETDISTQYSALKSNVVRSKNWNVKMPINEPAKGLRKSQIEEYLDFYEGPGVQHIALLTEDIVKTIAQLRENGVDFLNAPDSYYEELPKRVGKIDEDMVSLKRQGILVDREGEGYLLQLFTKPIEDRPTFFFEIIQRKGAVGFGQGNFQALFESIEAEQAKRGNL